MTAAISVSGFAADEYLFMVTRNGIIKRTELDLYKNIRKNGIIAINLDDDDELAWVKLTEGNDNLIVATKKGMSISFNEQGARAIGRTARGVKTIELKDGDEVIGMDILVPGKKVLTVSETGYGRLSEIDNYRLQSRGGKGLTNYHVDDYGDVATVEVVDPADDLMLISTDGIIIRIPMGGEKGIRLCARPSKGVRVMKVTEGEKLITAVSVKVEDDEPSETTDEAETVSEETSVESVEE